MMTNKPKVGIKLSLARIFSVHLYQNLILISISISISIKLHGSESRGQKESGLRDEPVSYLQVAPL